VIGFLRVIGLLNAAIWFGAAAFFALGAEPALFTHDTQGLLKQSFPYLSVLLAQEVRMGFVYCSLGCCGVAWLHLLGHWIYLGQPIRKFSLWLLGLMMVIVVVNQSVVQPRLKQAHLDSFVRPSPLDRQAAHRTYERWRTYSQIGDWLMVGGLALYLWRVANPPETMRFFSATKFRS
jgi:hypothetical protein